MNLKIQILKKKKIKFTNNSKNLKKANFYIICVPTPINKKKLPDLSFIEKSISVISNNLKLGDIIVLESTVYPGVTEKFGNYLEKKTSLTNNKDFFMCYSPERINPGDKTKELNNIKKVFAINTNKKSVKSKIVKIYNQISKKIIFSTQRHFCKN